MSGRLSAVVLALGLAAACGLERQVSSSPTHVVSRLAGAEIRCPVGVGARAGTVRCELRLPAAPGEIAALTVRSRTDEVSLGTVEPVSGAPEDAPVSTLELSFEVPGPGPMASLLEHTVSLSWQTSGHRLAEQTSLARLIGVGDVIVLPPHRPLPGRTAHIVIGGTEADRLDDPALQCRTGGEEGEKLVAVLSPPAGMAPRTARIEIPAAPGDAPLACTLEADLRRGWRIEVPFELEVTRGLESTRIWSDQAVSVPDNKARVMLAEPDPVEGKVEPLSDADVSVTWEDGRGEQAARPLAGPTSTWLHEVDVPSLKSSEGNLYYRARFPRPDKSMVELDVLSGAPTRAPVTAHFLSATPVAGRREHLRYDMIAHRHDGQPLIDEARMTMVVFISGVGWVTRSVMRDVPLTEEAWDQTVTLEDELLRHKRVGPILRVLAMSYMYYREQTGFSDSIASTFAPSRFIGFLVDREMLDRSDAAPGTVSRRASEAELAAVVTQADGRKAEGVEIALKGPGGERHVCYRSGSVLWACPGPPASAAATLKLVARPVADEDDLDVFDPRPATVRPSNVHMHLIEPVVDRGEPLRVKIRMDRGGEGASALGASAPAGQVSCSYPYLLLGWPLGRAPVQRAGCFATAGEEVIVSLPGLTVFPGPVELQAFWFGAGGRYRESVARAFVRPAGGMDPVELDTLPDRKVRVALTERAAEADVSFVWLSSRVDVEEHVVRADHLAAAAMGVMPRQGYTLWSSPTATDAGVLTRALAREIEGKTLEAALGLGQHAHTPAWAERGRSAGRSALTGEHGSYQGEVRSWVEHIGQAWLELSPNPGSPSQCMVEGAVSDFQAHAALLLIEGRGKLDVLLSPHEGVAGYDGLIMQWLGPDGLSDTADDIRSYFTVACGGLKPWAEPEVHMEAPEPAGFEIPYRQNRLVPTQSTKVWLSDGTGRSPGPWTSEPLHPGRWWVHAVGLKDSRLHYAAVRTLVLPFPADREEDYAKRRDAERGRAGLNTGQAPRETRGPPSPPPPPPEQKVYDRPGISLSAFGTAPPASGGAILGSVSAPEASAAGEQGAEAPPAPAVYGPPLPEDLRALEPDSPKRPAAGGEVRDYILPSFGVAPKEGD